MNKQILKIDYRNRKPVRRKICTLCLLTPRFSYFVYRINWKAVKINIMSQPLGVTPVFSFIPKKCLQSFCGGGVATIVVGPSGLLALSRN